MAKHGGGARRRSSDRQQRLTGPIECPWCGEVRGARISFGFPAWDADLEAAMARGEVVLGGCVIDVASPGWQCGACSRSWGVRDPRAWAWEIAEGRGELGTGGERIAGAIIPARGRRGRDRAHRPARRPHPGGLRPDGHDPVVAVGRGARCDPPVGGGPGGCGVRPGCGHVARAPGHDALRAGAGGGDPPEGGGGRSVATEGRRKDFARAPDRASEPDTLAPGPRGTPVTSVCESNATAT